MVLDLHDNGGLAVRATVGHDQVQLLGPPPAVPHAQQDEDDEEQDEQTQSPDEDVIPEPALGQAVVARDVAERVELVGAIVTLVQQFVGHAEKYGALVRAEEVVGQQSWHILAVEGIQEVQSIHCRTELVRYDERGDGVHGGETVGREAEGHGCVVVPPVVVGDGQGTEGGRMTLGYLVRVDGRPIQQGHAECLSVQAVDVVARQTERVHV